MSLTDCPIIVLGRQFSGNTMLTLALGRLPEVLSMIGEGTFFEHWPRLDGLDLKDRILRVAEVVGAGDPQFPKDQLEAVARYLIDFARQYPPGEHVSGLDLYLHAMRFLAEAQGKTRWAQKATSHIFYVEQILTVVPGAKLVYLARNPFDIAASIKRRGHPGQFFRMTWGWNRGMRRALRYQERHPENFLLVRYEDLVSLPETTMKRICAFAGVSFVSECLDIPHVNPSEAPYALVSGATGIRTSRLFYYRNVLDPSERTAIRWFVARDAFRSLFPELAEQEAQLSVRDVPTVAKYILSGLTLLIADQARAAVANPRHALDRLVKRMR